MGKVYKCKCGKKYTNSQSYVAHCGHCKVNLGHKPKDRFGPNRAWSKGRNKVNDKRVTWGLTKEQIFCKNSVATRKVIRNYLESEEGYKHQCSMCKNETWLGKKIPLEIDHINGINSDNRRENLRLICRNCHSFTDTYCGKNIKRGKIKKYTDEEMIAVLKESKNIRQALMKLEMTPKAGNYCTMYDLIYKNDIEHLM